MRRDVGTGCVLLHWLPGSAVFIDCCYARCCQLWQKPCLSPKICDFVIAIYVICCIDSPSDLFRLNRSRLGPYADASNVIRSSSRAGGSRSGTVSMMQEHSRSGTEVGTPPSDALEAAVASNARALLRTISVLQAAGAKLVQVTAHVAKASDYRSNSLPTVKAGAAEA